MHALLQRLGEPHLKTPAIHIAGTKGKGSTSAMVNSILLANGYTTGLYTSPHLHTFRERIRLGQEPVSEERFAALVEALWPTQEGLASEGVRGPVTVFEMLTAMAFVAFVQERVQFQVLEVGLGGRLDATNVVPRPLVCIITSLSLDHTAILGDTLDRIAAEKAGIVKPGGVVVTAPQPPEALAVIRRVCQERGATLVEVAERYRWERGPWDLEGQQFRVWGPGGPWDVWLPLLGGYQMENATCALAAAQALEATGVPLSREGVLSGFRQVVWPGRLEVLGKSPVLVVDGAHNPYSVGRLREAVQQYFTFDKVLLIFGGLADKNLEAMVAELAPLRPRVLATRSRHPRSAAPRDLAALFARHGLEAQALPAVAEAIRLAREQAGEGDLVLATGSLFVTAEVREALLGIQGEEYPELMPPVTLSQRSVEKR
ncbi:MAG: bifunctional folylpolyglutamate synthase/dihydrofolate synthase [Chloroflexi bacterium]|nr:bifunctional folylpolyglutamate synthase/dihydrofolate synthase [Chloroflexota bacterium]